MRKSRGLDCEKIESKGWVFVSLVSPGSDPEGGTQKMLNKFVG